MFEKVNLYWTVCIFFALETSPKTVPRGSEGCPRASRGTPKPQKKASRGALKSVQGSSQEKRLGGLGALWGVPEVD